MTSDALNGIGVTGMTVTNVLGCGIQKGKAEFTVAVSGGYESRFRRFRWMSRQE